MEIGEVGTYTELGVKVTEGSKDVTSDANISISYTEGGKKVDSISSPGEYIVTYVINYKDYNNTLTRNVRMK